MDPGIPEPSELFCEMTRISQSYHRMQGPIDGVIVQARTFNRAAADRIFRIGTPVEVCRPELGWPIDRILVAHHDGFAYAKRLCSEDGEHPDGFVDDAGRLSQEVVMGLCDGRANKLLSKTIEQDTIVQVYRKGDTYWAWTPDLSWHTWFSKDVEDIAQFIRVEDPQRLDYMPEVTIDPQPAPVVRSRAPRRKLR